MSQEPMTEAAIERMELPSSKTVFALANGDYQEAPMVVRDVLGRTLIMATGMVAFGASLKTAFKFGLAGSLAVETFALGYAVIKTRRP